MNLMFHIIFDVVGNILWVQHYTNMKCDVLFSQGRVNTLFRRGGYFFMYMCKYFFRRFTYNRCYLQWHKNYRNLLRFFWVMITNVLPLFFESRCMYAFVNRLMASMSRFLLSTVNLACLVCRHSACFYCICLH